MRESPRLAMSSQNWSSSDKDRGQPSQGADLECRSISCLWVLVSCIGQSILRSFFSSESTKRQRSFGDDVEATKEEANEYQKNAGKLVYRRPLVKSTRFKWVS